MTELELLSNLPEEQKNRIKSITTTHETFHVGPVGYGEVVTKPRVVFEFYSKPTLVLWMSKHLDPDEKLKIENKTGDTPGKPNVVIVSGAGENKAQLVSQSEIKSKDEPSE